MAKIKHLQMTTAQWGAVTTPLDDRRLGIEVKPDGTRAYKMGNGVDLWADLPEDFGGGGGGGLGTFHPLAVMDTFTASGFPPNLHAAIYSMTVGTRMGIRVNANGPSPGVTCYTDGSSSSSQTPSVSPVWFITIQRVSDTDYDIFFHGTQNLGTVAYCVQFIGAKNITSAPTAGGMIYWGVISGTITLSASYWSEN